MKKLGNWWNNKEIEIYEIEGKRIVLNKWNGEIYYDCFEVAENLIDIIANHIEVKPIYKEIAEDEFKIVDYQIM